MYKEESHTPKIDAAMAFLRLLFISQCLRNSEQERRPTTEKKAFRQCQRLEESEKRNIDMRLQRHIIAANGMSVGQCQHDISLLKEQNERESI